MLNRYERFTASIAGIYRSIQKIETDEIKKYDLKGSHAQYLAVMSQTPEGITAAQLCRACDKDKAAVSRALAELEEKGMLKRESTVSYRAKLMLTQKGKEAAGYVCRKAEAAVRLAEANISDEERETMYATLDMIAAHLRAICKDGLPDE